MFVLVCVFFFFFLCSFAGALVGYCGTDAVVQRICLPGKFCSCGEAELYRIYSFAV
jgi:hypothetical protein